MGVPMEIRVKGSRILSVHPICLRGLGSRRGRISRIRVVRICTTISLRSDIRLFIGGATPSNIGIVRCRTMCGHLRVTHRPVTLPWKVCTLVSAVDVTHYLVDYSLVILR